MLAGRSYRNVDILLRGLVNGADDFLVTRIDGLEVFPSMPLMNSLLMNLTSEEVSGDGGSGMSCGEEGAKGTGEARRSLQSRGLGVFASRWR